MMSFNWPGNTWAFGRLLVDRRGKISVLRYFVNWYSSNLNNLRIDWPHIQPKSKQVDLEAAEPLQETCFCSVIFECILRSFCIYSFLFIVLSSFFTSVNFVGYTRYPLRIGVTPENLGSKASMAKVLWSPAGCVFKCTGKRHNKF